MDNIESMKLRQPVTITVETVSEAIRLVHFYNHPDDVLTGGYAKKGDYPFINKVYTRGFTSKGFSSSKQFCQLQKALEQVGVNFRTGEIELKIAGHAVTHQAKGFKVGCTFVTDEELDILVEQRQKFKTLPVKTAFVPTDDDDCDL